MNFFYIMFVCVLLCNCVGKSGTELNSTNEHKVNDVFVSARFITREMPEKDTQSKEEFLYFNVRFEQPSINIDIKTAAYLDHQVENDFSMLDNGDTLRPVFAQRIANGQKGKYEYVIVFSREQLLEHTGTLNIIYEDKIFGIGRQFFEFDKSQI